MPGPWTGLRALGMEGAYAGPNMPPFMPLTPPVQPRCEPDDWTYTDLLWWRPVDVNLWEKDKDNLCRLAFTSPTYMLGCTRCETQWQEPLVADGRPTCFNCGKYVKLPPGFKDEREQLRRQEKNA